MAAPYSQDLRDRVLAAYDDGMQTRQIATLFRVCPAWARRVKQRRRETGETTPRRMGNPGIGKIDRGRLLELVRSHPDATLLELRQHLGIRCALSTVFQTLKKLGFSLKKRSSGRRSRIVPTSSSGGSSGPRGLGASTAGN